MTDTNSLSDRVSRMYASVKNLCNKERLYEGVRDYGAILVLSATWDFVGGGIDNPIPNIANGAGTFTGITIAREISSESRSYRGLARAVVAASLATVLRMRVNEGDLLSDYLIDVYSNTLRFVGSCYLPLFAYNIWNKMTGRDKETIPLKLIPTKTPSDTPSDLPESIKKRMRRFPKQSDN